MSIKLYKVVPKPAPPPPDKFELTGLTVKQVSWLATAVANRQNSLRSERGYVLNDEEYDFLRRLGAVLSGTNSCTVREE